MPIALVSGLQRVGREIMPAAVTVTKTIQADSARVWAIVRSFGGIHSYLNDLSYCHVQGSGEGAKLVCTTNFGSELREKLESVDESHRLISYSLSDSSTPDVCYLGALHVKALGENQTQICWSSRVDAANETAEQLLRQLKIAFEHGVDRMQSLLNTA